MAVTDTTRIHPSHLVDGEGHAVEDVTTADIVRRLESGTFFWLDLPFIGEQETQWLTDLFRYHPLAVRSAQQFGQRPRVAEYDNFTLIVMYGSRSEAAADAAGTVNPDFAGVGAGDHSIDDIAKTAEVHVFVAENSIITVHRSDCPAFTQLRDRLQGAYRATKVSQESKVLYLVADALVDSFLPVFDALDERIDALQDQVLQRPTNDQLQELLDHKKSLISLRRVLAPERDAFASISAGTVDIPGIDEDSGRYLRDVYDHLIRLTDLVDNYRDLLSGTTDAYMSVVSNQLNVVMKQLSIVATVFLPLSFLTGFFGQNFGWFTARIGAAWEFWGIGVGVEVLIVTFMLGVFWKRGWIGKKRPLVT